MFSDPENTTIKHVSLAVYLQSKLDLLIEMIYTKDRHEHLTDPLKISQTSLSLENRNPLKAKEGNKVIMTTYESFFNDKKPTNMA